MRLRLSPLHLLGAWLLYWLGLAIVTLGPIVPLVLRVTKEDAKGSMGLTMGDEGLTAKIADAGQVLWQGSISVTKLSMLLAIPPLLIWALWLWAQRRSARRPEEIGSGAESMDVAPREPAEELRRDER